MKKTLLVVLAACLLLPLNTFAQTYQTLWKQVENARDKDLPRQALTHLQKIEDKAQKEKAYGQLLKATLLTANIQQNIAPDSLAPAHRTTGQGNHRPRLADGLCHRLA